MKSKAAWFVALALFVPVTGIGQESPGSMQVEQPRPMAAAAQPSFEVATIKPSTSLKPDGNFRIGEHRIYVENQTIDSLISFAFGIHHKQITGAPAWLGTNRYDIVGQADVEGVPNLQQIQGMLRKLLEDRLQFKFHREKREISSYQVVIAKGGPRLIRSEDSPTGLPTQTGGHSGDGLSRTFTNNSMADFALGMQTFVDRPVVDRTGLPGRYNFTLNWAPDDQLANERSAQPGLFTAVQEQLGLKMTPVKAPVTVYVIDHVEIPSTN